MPVDNPVERCSQEMLWVVLVNLVVIRRQEIPVLHPMQHLALSVFLLRLRSPSDAGRPKAEDEGPAPRAVAGKTPQRAPPARRYGPGR